MVFQPVERVDAGDELFRIVGIFQVRAVAHHYDVALVAVVAQDLAGAVVYRPYAVGGVVHAHDQAEHEVAQRLKAVQHAAEIVVIFGVQRRHDGDAVFLADFNGKPAHGKGGVRMEQIEFLLLHALAQLSVRGGVPQTVALGRGGGFTAHHLEGALVRVFLRTLCRGHDELTVRRFVQMFGIIGNDVDGPVDAGIVRVQKLRYFQFVTHG